MLVGRVPDPLADPDALMDQYAARHSVTAIREDVARDRRAICQRSFVFITAACPQQFGNRFGEVLNSFALAVITDHTVLWSWSDDRGNCSQYVSPFVGRHEYMRVGDATTLRAEAGCAAALPSPPLTLESLMGGTPGKLGKHFNKRIKHLAIDALVYGKSFTASYKHQEVAWLAQNPGLGPEASQSAHLLFGSGSFRGFNAIFKSFFKFNDVIVNPYVDDLNEKSRNFRVGVHLRHGMGCSHHCSDRDTAPIACAKKTYSRERRTPVFVNHRVRFGRNG